MGAGQGQTGRKGGTMGKNRRLLEEVAVGGNEVGGAEEGTVRRWLEALEQQRDQSQASPPMMVKSTLEEQAVNKACLSTCILAWRKEGHPFWVTAFRLASQP